MDNKIQIILKEIQIKLDALEDKVNDLQELKDELERYYFKKDMEEENATL